MESANSFCAFPTENMNAFYVVSHSFYLTLSHIISIAALGEFISCTSSQSHSLTEKHISLNIIKIKVNFLDANGLGLRSFTCTTTDQNTHSIMHTGCRSPSHHQIRCLCVYIVLCAVVYVYTISIP